MSDAHPDPRAHPLRRAFGAPRRWRARRRCAVSCEECGSELVCPMEWGEAGDDAWWVDWRCGECGTWLATVMSNAQAARLDCRLDRQAAVLRWEAERIERERMAEQDRAFIQALRRDLIGAADFA